MFFWHGDCFYFWKYSPKRKMTSKKSIPILFLCTFLIISTPVSAGTDQGPSVECPGCVESGVKYQEREKRKIQCFNCDRRPCVATRDAWIRLWHKYWGVDVKDDSKSSKVKEDRK